VAQRIESTLQIGGVTTGEVIRFRETHRLGVPARLEITVRLLEYVALDELVGVPALLNYTHRAESVGHSFAGVVDAATVSGTSVVGDNPTTVEYAFEIVSTLELLSRDFGCNTFQDLTVPDVLKKFFDACGLAASTFEWRLTQTYAPRDWCVRYQESGLAFVSRLCEHEGIFFFSEVAEDGSEKIVFADDSTAAAPIDGEPSLVVRPRTGLEEDAGAIYSVRERHRVVPGKFVLRDYAFEKPALDLTETATADIGTDLEVYDYPGGYFDPTVGKRLVRARLDAAQAERRTLVVEAETGRIAAGRKLTITESAGPADGSFVVTALVAEFEEESEGEGADEGGGEGAIKRERFRVTASLLPATAKFRPACVTPKPLIAGLQTATIVAPDGSQPEEIHTDQHGRVKLRFHWDTSGVGDDKASAWFRTEQLQTSGSMILPRVNWEVLVDFLEGDPDRPIVVGRVYNGMFMPPYALPGGKTRTAIKTVSTPGGGGTNEIRFEDQAGAEEIMIHAQKDMSIEVANDKNTTIGNNETSVVKINSTLQVGGNQELKVTKGVRTAIGANQSVDVSGSRTIEVNAVAGLNVGGNSKTTVGGGQKSMVGSPLKALLALAAEKAAEVAAAKAGEALAHIDGAIQGKVNQALGPVNSLVDQAKGLGAGMKALGAGDLSAAPGVLGAAASIPSASSFLGGLAATRSAGGGESSAEISATNMLQGAAQQAIQRGVDAGADALGAALGLDGGAAGGESLANAAGPEGNVDGVDQTDRTKGPGHTLYKIAGTHKETVGTMKALVALNGINTNVTKTTTETVAVAKIEAAMKDYAESVEGSKTETAIGGLLVYTKGDESEHVGGSKTTMVGGAIIDKIKGGHSIEAKAPATFVAAFHKVEAKQKITFKCGPSEIVIDGSGIVVTSPMIMVTAGKIELPKAATEL